MIKVIEDKGQILAKIIRRATQTKECEFFTDENSQIQFGIMNYPKNYKTGAHFHNRFKYQTANIDEIIIVQKGSMRADFYNEESQYVVSCEIFEDDVLIIYKGGHNLFFLDDTKIYTVKSGAYAKFENTTRTVSANNFDLKIEND